MIIVKDVLDGLDDIEDDSINLIFTSPPYWKGFEYESIFNAYLQYINWCKLWIKKLKIKLKEDGFFLLNISNDTETTIKAFEILQLCIDAGWKLHDTIIWNVYNRQPANTNRHLTNEHEYIFLFRHNSNNVDIHKNNLWKEYPDVFSSKKVGNVWKIPFKVRKQKLKRTIGKWGSSGFPDTLCEIVLKLFSKEDDKVLDCFCGHFTFGNIGLSLNRKMIGIDKIDYAETTTVPFLSVINRSTDA